MPGKATQPAPSIRPHGKASPRPSAGTAAGTRRGQRPPGARPPPPPLACLLSAAACQQGEGHDEEEEGGAGKTRTRAGGEPCRAGVQLSPAGLCPHAAPTTATSTGAARHRQREGTGTELSLPPMHGEAGGQGAEVLRWLMAWEGCKKPPEDPRQVLRGWGGMERPPSLSPGSRIAPARARSSLWMALLTGTGGGDVGAPWAGVPVPGPPPHHGRRKQPCPAFPEDEDFLPPIERGP